MGTIIYKSDNANVEWKEEQEQGKDEEGEAAAVIAEAGPE